MIRNVKNGLKQIIHNCDKLIQFLECINRDLHYTRFEKKLYYKQDDKLFINHCSLMADILI